MADPFTPEAIEAARKAFAGPVAFLKSAPKLEFLPDPDVPEIAFAGRSNVGKSSLLNALTNRNGLARTSNTPGRTQELNFFDVGEPLAFRLVDMPGYGFAKAPKDVVKKWRYLVNDFLRGRDVLKRALFYGGVMGSFAVERFGTERLQNLTREEIDARFQVFRELTHLE